MIFDFRLRPPYKSYLDTVIYNPVCNTVAPHDVNAYHTPSAHERSMELFLKEMEEAGIDQGVVMGRATSGVPGVSNEDILQLTKEYPGKFVPFGSVDARQGIAAALKEVRKCAEWGFKGICVEPPYSEPACMFDAACFYPVYALCEEMGLILATTMSFFVGPTVDYSNPAAVQRVAADFPTLRIVVSHACYPWVPQVMNIPLTHPNVWLQPDMYILNHNCPGNQQWYDFFRWLKGNNILFGSAYPCFDLRQAVKEVERFELPDDIREKYFWKNAHKLLGL